MKIRKHGKRFLNLLPVSCLIRRTMKGATEIDIALMQGV